MHPGRYANARRCWAGGAGSLSSSSRRRLRSMAATSCRVGPGVSRHVESQASALTARSAVGIMLPNHAPLVIAEQFGTLKSPRGLAEGPCAALPKGPVLCRNRFTSHRVWKTVTRFRPVCRPDTYPLPNRSQRYAYTMQSTARVALRKATSAWRTSLRDFAETQLPGT